MIRFKPYSHEREVLTLIPNSLFGAHIFPCYVKVFDLLTDKTIVEKHFPATDFIDPFTVFLDLEKARVEVLSGTFRYFIQEGKILVNEEPTLSIIKREKLFLGCSKAQDVTLLFRRGNLVEIAPILFLLSQSLPASSVSIDLSEFQQFVQIGLKSLFFPKEWVYQGSALTKSPLQLLQSSHLFLRSLFFQEERKSWRFLPELLPEFHAGCLEVETVRSHVIKLEWSKKSIRHVEIRAQDEESYQFKFSNDIKRFRLRTREKVLWLNNRDKIEMKKGEVLTLDHFEK